MQPTNLVTDQTQLRTVYREPGQTVLDKVIDHIDRGVADFLAVSPFAVLATASADRTDASPRGGPPGFARVLDQHRLAWGDLTGNNRLDSFTNVVQQPHVGLVFMVPGVLETLRVNGSATLVQDPAVLEACAIDGRVPKTAVVVEVRECYIQCGAALRRADIWNPDSWPAADVKPSAAAILKEHIGSDAPAEAIAEDLDSYYENYRWLPGGTGE